MTGSGRGPSAGSGGGFGDAGMSLVARGGWLVEGAVRGWLGWWVGPVLGMRGAGSDGDASNAVSAGKACEGCVVSDMETGLDRLIRQTQDRFITDGIGPGLGVTRRGVWGLFFDWKTPHFDRFLVCGLGTS